MGIPVDLNSSSLPPRVPGFAEFQDDIHIHITVTSEITLAYVSLSLAPACKMFSWPL
jgi:hypothetical protein